MTGDPHADAWEFLARVQHALTCPGCPGCPGCAGPDHAPRYGVLRAAPDLPPGFMPPDLEGRWIELADPPPDGWPLVPATGAVAVATDRFERRDDGATARVYEFRP